MEPVPVPDVTHHAGPFVRFGLDTGWDMIALHNDNGTFVNVLAGRRCREFPDTRGRVFDLRILTTLSGYTVSWFDPPRNEYHQDFGQLHALMRGICLDPSPVLAPLLDYLQEECSEWFS
jgi:hypothetical protein